LVFITSQDPKRRHMFPQISDTACRSAMQLVLPDGRVFPGERALPYILRTLAGWRMVAWIFYIPGVRIVAGLFYRLIAQNRYRLTCNAGVCELPRAQTPPANT
jgi:predicted DCC family thiol-disulfide oxidoreductase YuxK